MTSTAQLMQRVKGYTDSTEEAGIENDSLEKRNRTQRYGCDKDKSAGGGGDEEGDARGEDDEDESDEGVMLDRDGSEEVERKREIEGDAVVDKEGGGGEKADWEKKVGRPFTNVTGAEDID
jgi:hypothetical protein